MLDYTDILQAAGEEICLKEDQVMQVNEQKSKRSIKEFSTSGMLLWEREELFSQVDPIPVGEKVFRAGDAWSYTESLSVTEENQKEVTMFWNALYFDNEKDADRRTSRAHGDYGSYQSLAASGW